MALIIINMESPSVNIIQDSTDNKLNCFFLNITTLSGENVRFHFNNKEELLAYKGLLDIAINGFES